jgi:hypothetical protein
MVDDDRKKPILGLPGPMGLPEPVPNTDSLHEASLQALLDKSRKCPKCGKEGRIVSNNNGVNGFCGPCQIHWPVTNSPLRGEVPGSPQRGLHKETSVEPDWNIAFDRDVGDN